MEKLKIKKSVAQPWLEALRSGKYLKNILRFESEGKYCALGLFCLVNGQKIRDDGGEDDYTYVKKHLLGAVTYRNLRMEAWQKIYWLNDTEKLSFKAIAEYIEDTFELIDDEVTVETVHEVVEEYAEVI